MPKNVNPFIFNDETIANNHGFFIVTDGIDLTRFILNPVMLEDHCNSADDVLGKWTDIKKEEGKLLGMPEFDVVDEDANKIAGKVERGFIKACSMGIVFSPEDMVFIGGNIILQKCELIEVSIVAVPSNRNSIQLYKEPGVPFENEEIHQLTLSLTKNENLNLNQFMKKIILNIGCLMALGFTDAPKDGIDESEIETRVLGLSAKLKSLETENASLKLAAKAVQEAQEAEKKESVTRKVKLAIQQGKFAADKETEMITLGITSEAALDTVIGAIQGKQTFGASITNTEGGTEIKTPEDFQKLDLNAQLAFKESNPDAYKKLFS